jgi:hypothetical protein
MIYLVMPDTGIPSTALGVGGITERAMTRSIRADRGGRLGEASRWCGQCIELPSWANPRSTLYRAAEWIAGAVNGAAEVGIGNRKRSCQVTPRARRPDLPLRKGARWSRAPAMQPLRDAILPVEQPVETWQEECHRQEGSKCARDHNRYRHSAALQIACAQSTQDGAEGFSCRLTSE